MQTGMGLLPLSWFPSDSKLKLNTNRLLTEQSAPMQLLYVTMPCCRRGTRSSKEGAFLREKWHPNGMGYWVMGYCAMSRAKMAELIEMLFGTKSGAYLHTVSVYQCKPL